MSFQERAKHYVIRQRGRTFLLAVILVVALLIGLFGIMILRSFEHSILAIGEQSNAKITIFTTDLERLISPNQIDALYTLGNISWVNRANEVIAIPGNFEIGMGDGEDTANAGARLQGFDDLNWDSLFGQEVTMLVYGSLELPENGVIVHQLLAMMNGLSLGDSLTFHNSGMTVNGIITGIYAYTDPEMRNEAHTTSMFRFENLIFTHPALVNQLNGEDGYAEAHFYVIKPNVIQDTRNAFEHELRQTIFEIRVSDALFRRIAVPLTQTAGLTTIILAITGIGVLVVISLLLTLWSRERRKETALLMSIGEQKANIVMQRLIEVMAIYLLAFMLVMPVVLVASPYIGAFYQGVVGLTDIENLSFGVSAVDVIGVFSAGIVTLMLAITLSCLSVMRLTPKSILSRND